MKYFILSLLLLAAAVNDIHAQPVTRKSFNDNWKFHLGDLPGAQSPSFDDVSWRSLSLPHDWSIELPFDKESPTGTGGGSLRGGIGWYRKTFSLPASAAGKSVTIDFDAVYRNSEVWMNGSYLGKRPNGYISFQYDLTPYLRYGKEKNTIAVKVDNAEQPNSRWYSGSGIYRNTWLTITGKTHVAYNGIYFTTPTVNNKQALVEGEITIVNEQQVAKKLNVITSLLDASGKVVATTVVPVNIGSGETKTVSQHFTVANPLLWSVERPYLYKAITSIKEEEKLLDQYKTTIGIRSFLFDAGMGFLLNGKKVKIRGVCNHHDLGCLGVAVNRRALQRQLEILKRMGCNGIRTSHNPPAPELLALCDEMGFIVMNEAFDIWKKKKTEFDYHRDWDEWHRKDLVDHVIRDRNHPSVFIWSVGNEVGEQWGDEKDSTGRQILKELVDIVRQYDPVRPTVTANNEVNPWSKLLQSNSADMIGYNYNHQKWDSVFYTWGSKSPAGYADKPFIVTESVSGLMTRGHYDMPSDSIRRWPKRWDIPLTEGNPDTTCSAYDNCATPWGSTHEQTLKEFEKYDHISGMYIWTGFDYIGEPTPYGWPARSSYFGIIDLAGFPKDVYYMYQAAWTTKPVLHIFPHWNWSDGDTVDVWAYYNNAEEAELFLDGVSLGTRKKEGDEQHVMWRVAYKPGILEAVSKKNGKPVIRRQIRTAGPAAKILLEADRKLISRTNDLSFVTVKIVDKDGNLVPDAANLVRFSLNRGGIAAVDNGNQTSMESFKANKRKAFNGLCLAVISGAGEPGLVRLTATAEGLSPAIITITVK